MNHPNPRLVAHISRFLKPPREAIRPDRGDARLVDKVLATLRENRRPTAPEKPFATGGILWGPQASPTTKPPA